MALSNKNILAAMLERATNPAAENVDELAVQIFCVTVRNDPNLIHEAMSLIVSKIQSSNVTQSIRGVSLLEECMDKCGSTFQDEVSKFRFLNDLIRLVSNKYQGKKTPTQIRDKIMDCLLLWTTEYPDKIKIREAYDLLRKEGTDHGSVPVMSTVKKDTIMGIDEEKFRKLVQSKNADDFKRANLLVQARVNQDAKRMELMCRHKSELQEIKNTASLLNQMLDSFEQNSSGEEGETVNLIKELYDSCENYVPIIERLPELIDNTNEKLIDETIEVNDYLQAVIERYKAIFLKNKPPKASSLSSTTAQPSTAITTSDLLSGLLAQPEPIKPTSADKAIDSTPNPLDELSEIFGNMENSTSKIQASLFENMNLLEPSTVLLEVEQPQNEKNNDLTSSKYDSRKLTAIDIMSEELLKASLQNSERMCSFKKEPERVSLNDLAKEKTMIDSTLPSAANLAKKVESVLLSPTLPKSEKISEEKEKPLDDNSFENNSKDELILGEPEIEKSDQNTDKEENLPVVHLADIQIDLDDVCPTTEKLLLDDDIKVTLNFTSNRPSPNVSVIVVSVTNQSKLPVTSFHFDASVRKPSKVRLLPATGDSMPGAKPFRPATPINLIMLLLNPTKSDVDVTCIVGYKLGDDPDPIKESIVAKNIAYVD
ncbi:ADP-ribosylation factor-binding protein GGA3 [Episyrphus balteatus]|uniref:ADP-ribosylation factor-binding protein GGA3 n=1 Tax=Episyrphus balteatus TaxID=286459 RepID=UPI002485D1AF|nr:ADP-ribosylation factor-binding protein GGA3 [Episyrphus balteatus]